MRRWTVEDVMTENVISVGVTTPYKEIVETLARHGVSAVPVVDAERRVLGVVSEADLLYKMEATGLEQRLPIMGRKQRRARDKATGDVAGDLMTTPAITVGRHAAVAAVARTMDQEQIKRLPVVDERDHLQGIVSRADLLRVYLREDEAIRDEIRDQILFRTLWIDPATINVAVDHGVVTLTGRADRKSTVDIIGRFCEAASGVVEVVNQIVPEFDDTELLHRKNVMSATVKQSIP